MFEDLLQRSQRRARAVRRTAAGKDCRGRTDALDERAREACLPDAGVAAEDDTTSGAIPCEPVERHVELRELPSATDDRRLEVPGERLGPRIEAEHAVALA